MKLKILKYTALALLFPIVLVLLLAAILYVPPIQRWAVNGAASYASTATGMDIRVQYVRLKFPIDLVVGGVAVVAEQDTLLTIEQVKVDVQLAPLFRKEIAIDGFSLSQLYVNTASLIPTVQLRGNINQLYLASHAVELDPELAVVDRFELCGARLSLGFKDTLVEEESDTAAICWKFDLRKVSLAQVAIDLHTAPDSRLAVEFDSLTLQNGYVDLASMQYNLQQLRLCEGTICDHTSSLALSHVALQMQDVAVDSVRCAVPQCQISTPSSQLDMQLAADWCALEVGGVGVMTAQLNAALSKTDCLSFMGSDNKPFVRNYPDAPITLQLGVVGNVDSLSLTAFRAALAHRFDFQAEGAVRYALDSLQRSANLTWQANLEDLDFLAVLIDQTGGLTIPHHITLDGSATVMDAQYTADVTYRCGADRAALHAAYNAMDSTYEAACHIDSMQVCQFLPCDPNHYFAAHLTADGKGITLRTDAGDMALQLDCQTGLNALVPLVDPLTTRLTHQLETMQFDLAALKPYLPQLTVTYTMGEQNPLTTLLAAEGTPQFEQLHGTVITSPTEGVAATCHLYALHTDSLAVDTVRFALAQAEHGLTFKVEAINAPKPEAFAFNAALQGVLQSNGVAATLLLQDEAEERLVDMGFEATLTSAGVQLHVAPYTSVLAYQTFHFNSDNHLYYGYDGTISGNVSLFTDGGMGLQLSTTPNEEALHDITLRLCKLDLATLLTALPFVDITAEGLLNAELQYMDNAVGQMLVRANLAVDAFAYEHCAIGDVTAQVEYVPKDAQTHAVRGTVALDGKETMRLDGEYVDNDEGLLALALCMVDLPLGVANGFIPDQLMTLEGTLAGDLRITGSMTQPLINGALTPHDVAIGAESYGLRFGLDEQPLAFVDSRLQWQAYKIYDRGASPIVIDGYVDLGCLDAVTMDLKIKANDYELINAPRQKDAVVYGKVYLDMIAVLQGTTDNLSLRGSVTVQGKTDVTYLLDETPLTVEDRLAELVTFVDFSASTPPQVDEAKQLMLGSLDMQLALNIDAGASIRVDLSSDRSSYLELYGGGEFMMQYNQYNDLSLTGRYLLMGGEMKYELPIIPLKTFTIKPNSYVEFTGDPFNPSLNMAATERVRTTISSDGQQRSVAFDVGVAISNSLSDMGVTFTLEAPEDITMQNELAAMSLEEKGKIAVTMLATGMYIGTNGGSGNITASNALNAFLQNEISNIAGNALRTVDISVGVEDSTDTDGTSHTDYSFRFAKRFWNNRLSVVVGGKISSGNDAAEGSGSSFIEDISLEWRLDDSGTRYLRLFHNKNYESILEGEIIETGVGIVLQRKMTQLGELFIFNRKKRKRDGSN